MNSFKEFEEKAWEKKAHLYEDSWGKVTSQPNSRILEIANVSASDKLLDIGCGAGHFSNQAYLTGADVTGCDHSKEMTKIAISNYPEINFQSGDAEHLDFEDDTFDVVTLNYLLLHVPDQKKVLKEAKRVLKINGRLIYTLWQPPLKSLGFNLILGSIKNHADTSVIPPADDIFQFTEVNFAKSFFEENSFIDFKTEIFATSFEVKDEEGFYSAILAGARMGGTIELQATEIKEKIKKEIFSGLAQFKTDNGFSVPIPSVITSVKKIN